MTNSEIDLEEIVEKLNYVIDKIGELERRLVTVEKSLEQVNNLHQIDSGRKVTEALETPTIIKVDLSASQLIEIYNHNFQELASNAIKVSVTLDSLLTRNDNTILLEKTRNANYWIIVTQDDHHWLLPKGNLKINTYNYKTVESLFKCNVSQPYTSSKFTLNQLAKVELTPNGQQWMLVERGILQFITTNVDESEEIDIENLAENANIHSQSSVTVEEPNSTFQESEVDQELVFLTAELLVDDYNFKRNAFSTMYSVIEVSETEESINKRLFENVINIQNNTQTTFEKARIGHYWIVNLDTINYLVPKLNIIINSDTLEIVQALFECQNYKYENFHKFILIKAAKLSVFQEQNWSVINSAEKWILQERGMLRFTS